MNDLLSGVGDVFQPEVLLALLLGTLIGLLVGAFPGVTATMAVALASGFTLTMEPVSGLAVLLTIYVSANFGDRIPSILINTPGTPASVATTLDGYPMAKNGQGGQALFVSAVVTIIGIGASIIFFMAVAVPAAQFAVKFGPAEMFALVLCGLTIMISISSKSLLKGAIAGLFGLLLGAVGRDPISGDERFTFGIPALTDGLDFIPVIIGLFGIAEVFYQITQKKKAGKDDLVSELGKVMPSRSDWRRIIKPTGIGTVVGLGVGIVPAAGGDIAGIIGWDRARAASKTKDQFGKGNVEGLAAADSASSATLGGSLATTLALGIPGDSVMAVMIGSMIIWGIQPGPSLFVNQPNLVASIASIMVLATVLGFILSIIRLKPMVKLVSLPNHYVWATVLVFCIVGTYATTNNIHSVIMMLAFGLVGLLMRINDFPTGPVVLGLLLGPLAEANLRRSILIDGPWGFLSHPIALILVLLSVAAVVIPVLRKAIGSSRGKKKEVEGV